MTQINIRIEEKTKRAASKALADIGLDLSTGVKLFLHQVVTEKGMPFTPTKNPAVLRAKWDKEIAEARKRGKFYKSAEDMLEDIL
jgi:DNA-damage-inducible protein J